MEQQKNEVLPGTLNLMVLKTLSTLGPLHGYGIARRIEQISGNQLQLNQRRASEIMIRFLESSGENA